MDVSNIILTQVRWSGEGEGDGICAPKKYIYMLPSGRKLTVVVEADEDIIELDSIPEFAMHPASRGYPLSRR